MDVENRVIVVTGAAGNLGRAVAAEFARSNDSVVMVDHDMSRLKQLFGSDTTRQMLAAADLYDSEKTREAMEAIVARFGKIDVLCNIAGGFRMGTMVHETSDEEFDYLFGINVRTMMNATRAVVPEMLRAKAGKVINISAYSAQRGAGRMGAYCASKDVVIRLTEAMAQELRDSNINVNCVLPSILDTPQNRHAMPDSDFSAWVKPVELAEVVFFLASHGARAIHGAAIPVTARC